MVRIAIFSSEPYGLTEARHHNQALILVPRKCRSGSGPLHRQLVPKIEKQVILETQGACLIYSAAAAPSLPQSTSYSVVSLSNSFMA